MPDQTEIRLDKIRKVMIDRGLHGLIIPNTDEHQSEYTPPHAERLAWLLNFRGTAGLAVVFLDQVALFVDGRYTLQARQQTNDKFVTVFLNTEVSVHDWLQKNIRSSMKIAYDPWTLTEREVIDYQDTVEECAGVLVPTELNLVDFIWDAKPPFPQAEARIHPLEFSGKPKEEKISALCEVLRKGKMDAYATSLPESINWLLNIRGGDLEVVPLILAHMIVHRDEKVELFVHINKIPSEVRTHLGTQVQIFSYEDFGDHLGSLGRKKLKVLVDVDSTSVKVLQAIEHNGGTVIRQSDPCLLPKACKNETEVNGTRQAHIRDGAALTNFLAWLAREAPKGNVDELKAAEVLLAFRAKQKYFRGVSFPTISSAGANGAVVHYRVTPETNQRLKADDIYLIDSGGQYLDGTTDVTRTVAMGQTTSQQRERFTRVLKGHILIAQTRFPKGTTGSQLDCLARIFLWEVGLDYGHGTGHGVGSYMGVHEGPQRIATAPNRVPLMEGMILSNEPGYYREGAYGIRIENLVVVQPMQPLGEGAEKALLGFETLTLAPIDLNLVEVSMLSEAEKNWLNTYHKRVLDTLSPLVEGETISWLQEATRPV